MALKSLLPLISLSVIFSAGVTIVAHYLRPPRPTLIYVFKPLTTILILIVALLPGTFLADRYAGAIGLGLLFSLAGDVWLMLPGNRFLYGLVSFLLAHICYIFAFFTNASASDFPWPVIPLALIGAIILMYLWPALSASLKGAVGLYVAVIVVMATLAVSRSIASFSIGTLSAAIGALLFMASDAMLSINRFRRPFHLAQAAVLGTYFVGQLFIALSVGLQAY
jgi:uncharacterized membrane protein YhhN